MSKRPNGGRYSKRMVANQERDAVAKEPLLWTSPESTDLDKLIKGEASIDWSKGEWVTGPKKRPELNLIDVLLHRQTDLGYGYVPSRLKLLQAQRFMMDAPASRFMGEVTMDWGRQALAQHELTRAPFELTWLEFDAIAYASVVPTYQGPEPDLKVGFLYDHGDVYVASITANDELAMFMPYRIRLNTPVSFEEEQEMAEFFRLSRLTYRMFLMGTLGEGGQVPIDAEFWGSPEVTHLCRSHRFELEPRFRQLMEDSYANERERHRLVQSSSGIVKQVILAFILLTRPNKHVYFGEASEPAKRVWLKNRQVPTVSYTRLTMHLAQKDAVRRIGHEITGRHQKHHDVKGHWCQSRKKGRGCAHNFVLVDKDHGECSHGCGARTWWRAKCERGDIKLGSTSKTYEVTE